MASLVEVVDGAQCGMDRKRCPILDLNTFPDLELGNTDAEAIYWPCDGSRTVQLMTSPWPREHGDET